MMDPKTRPLVTPTPGPWEAMRLARNGQPSPLYAVTSGSETIAFVIRHRDASAIAALPEMAVENERLRAAADQSITDLQGIVNLSDCPHVCEIANHIADALGAALPSRAPAHSHTQP